MRTRLLDPASIDRRPLANGLTALVRVDRSAPVVAIVTYLNVGYFDEPDELAGISHVLEHMFFKGTPTRGPGQIAQATKEAGGYLNAATIYDFTRYYTVLPARSLAEGLAIQSDALLNSVLDAGELSRELQVIIQEARRKLDNPSAVAAESLYELMFDRHRMRRWRIGTESFLSTLTRAQLHDFYRTFYRAGRTIVVVAGDVDADVAHQLIAEHYGALASGAPPFERGAREPDHAGLRLCERSGDIVHTHVEIGWPTPPPLHDDSPALDVLGVILGQGRASRLYRGVRERGLVHSITARNYSPTELGVFQISAELHAEHTLPALAATAAAVHGVADTIDAAEVERARTLIEARTLRRLESMEGQASHLAEWQALGDWQLGTDYLERLARLDARAVQSVAQQYLAPKRAAIFVYRPLQAETLGCSSAELQTRFEAQAPLHLPALAQPSAHAAHNHGVELERVEDDVFFFRTRTDVPIVIKPRHNAPLVSLALAVAGGANLETRQQAGCTALAARASIKGTARYSAAQLASAAETLGSSIHPGVSADLVDWSCSVPAQHFGTALDLLLEAALAPCFPEQETENERRIALADLQQIRDDMYRYPLRLFLQTAFPDHAYGLPLEQTEAVLSAVGAEDLRAWHRSTVIEQQATIFVVGDVEPHEVARQVARSLETGGSAHAQPAAAQWNTRPSVLRVERPKAQTALVLGFPGVAHDHPDAIVLQVLANAIAGLGGRLFEELRSRRALAYTVAAFPVVRALGGAFVAYIAMAPEREAEARQALLAELRHLREAPLPAAELERARRYTVGTWQIHSQTNTAQLHRLMAALLIGRGLIELREYESRVLSVSPEHVRAAAQRYFDETRLMEAVVQGTGPSTTH